MNEAARKAMSRACPPRVGEAEREPKRRPPLARVSARRAAELGDEPRSTFKPQSKPTLKRTAGPKPSRGKRSKGTPDEIGEWRRQAFERVMADHDGWLVDEATGLSAGIAHRVVDGFPLVLHPANAMVLSTARHNKHHAPGIEAEPIPLAALREETWDLVLRLDEGTGKQEWEQRMRRDYEGDR